MLAPYRITGTAHASVARTHAPVPVAKAYGQSGRLSAKSFSVAGLRSYRSCPAAEIDPRFPCTPYGAIAPRDRFFPDKSQPQPLIPRSDLRPLEADGKAFAPSQGHDDYLLRPRWRPYEQPQNGLPCFIELITILGNRVFRRKRYHRI